MTIASPFQIPMREPPIDERTGLLSRPWYLFLQNLINLAQPDSGITVDDLAVAQIFDGDNTTQVADVQRQIDEIVIDIGSFDEDTFATTGTVRYVNATAPTGVLGVSGVPYQNSGAVTLAWSGTSGGIPYFSGTTSMASSALLTNHALIVGGGAGATPAALGSLGTTTTVLHGNASGNPTFGAVVLTTDVSGTLPIGSGGTNSATALSGSSIMVSNGSAVVQGAAGTTITVLHGNPSGAPTYGAVVLTTDVSGTLPVANGGTGTASATAYAVLCGGTTTTGPFQPLAALGASGTVLTSNGPAALPSFQAVVASVPSYVFAFAAAHG